MDFLAYPLSRRPAKSRHQSKPTLPPKRNSSFFDVIPIEILCHIASFLGIEDGFRTRKSFLQTCKRFYSISDRMFEQKLWQEKPIQLLVECFNNHDWVEHPICFFSGHSLFYELDEKRATKFTFVVSNRDYSYCVYHMALNIVEYDSSFLESFPTFKEAEKFCQHQSVYVHKVFGTLTGRVNEEHLFFNSKSELDKKLLNSKEDFDHFLLILKIEKFQILEKRVASTILECIEQPKFMYILKFVL